MMNRRRFFQSSLAVAVATALPARRLYALDQAASQAAGGLAAVKLDGSATVIAQSELAELKSGLRGPLLLAGDPGYDAARRVLNESIDLHPALVVQPTGVADVRRAVDFARERELLVAVKCGGHSPSGKSTCEKGMQIDLSRLRGVRVDPRAQRAWVEGGSLLGEIDHEAMAHGLVTTCGTVSHTGVGGLTLGGGFGRLARRFGLALDNVMSVDVVTADGTLRHASSHVTDHTAWIVQDLAKKPKDAVAVYQKIAGKKGDERAVRADATVARLLDSLVEDGGYPKGTRLALLVNGLGATPPLELALVARAALSQLRERGLVVERAWTGTFLSALDMPGCSLSLLPVDEACLALLDAPTQARAWPGDGRVPAAPTLLPAPAAAAETIPRTPGPLAARLQAAADAVIASLLANEARLTDLDSRAGDGDLGTSLARGAEAMRALTASAWYTPASALAATGQALRRAIGGSSGPFYACALVRAAQVLDGVERPTLAQWAEAFDGGVQALAELGAEYRDAILLKEIEELQYEEIAEILDCPIGTVRSRIHRARQLLREKLARVVEREQK